MPNRPKTPCKHPGCGMLVEYGQKYCTEHKSMHPEYTRASGKRGYSSAWQKASKAYLREHPLCVECLKLGRYTQATVVDHINPHRGDKVIGWVLLHTLTLMKVLDHKTTEKGNQYKLLVNPDENPEYFDLAA